MHPKVQVKQYLREWAGTKGKVWRARGHWLWRMVASGGGKLVVNGLKQMAGGEGGTAKGPCLNVLNPLGVTLDRIPSCKMHLDNSSKNQY